MTMRARRLGEKKRVTVSPSKRGYTYSWQKESKAFLGLPENLYCSCGCGKVSMCVDHIIPHRGDAVLFWDKANWQGMAYDCHNAKTLKGL